VLEDIELDVCLLMSTAFVPTLSTLVPRVDSSTDGHVVMLSVCAQFGPPQCVTPVWHPIFTFLTKETYYVYYDSAFGHTEFASTFSIPNVQHARFLAVDVVLLGVRQQSESPVTRT